jgi:hypothetical protein
MRMPACSMPVPLGLNGIHPELFLERAQCQDALANCPQGRDKSSGRVPVGPALAVQRIRSRRRRRRWKKGREFVSLAIDPLSISRWQIVSSPRRLLRQFPLTSEQCRVRSRVSCLSELKLRWYRCNLVGTRETFSVMVATGNEVTR